MNTKQTNLLVDVLVNWHTSDGDTKFCYLEMIALLFGEDRMQQIIEEFNIVYKEGKMRNKRKNRIDLSLLKLTEPLKREMELRLELLNGIVRVMGKKSGLILDQ